MIHSLCVVGRTYEVQNGVDSVILRLLATFHSDMLPPSPTLLNTTISVVMAFVCVVNIAQAQWQQLNGPYGGTAGGFATVGNTVFTINNEHIYRSSDLGSTWEEVGSGQLGDRLEVIVAVGERLFLSSRDSMYVSTDLGNNWRKLSITFDRISSMVVMDSTLFAACYYDFVVSTDFGESWTSIRDKAPFEYPFTITHSGSHLFLIRRGHYVSTDRGLTWKQMTDSSQRRFNTFLFEGNKLLGGSDYGLHASTDLGTSWTRIGNELKSVNVLQLMRRGNYLYAVTDEGVFRSSTNGATWDNVLLPKRASGMRSIVIARSRLLASHGNDGIYASVDDGTTWTRSNNGLIATSAQGLLHYRNRMFAACGGSGLFVSDDLGNVWEEIAGFEGIEVRWLAHSGQSIVAGTSKGWYRSLDTGRTWTIQDDTYTKNNSVLALSCENGLLAVISNYLRCVVYKSSDDGATWTFLNETTLPAFPTNHTTYNIENHVVVDSGVVYAITDGGLSISETEGRSWRNVDAYMPGSEYPYAFTGVGAHGNNVVVSGWGHLQYRSTDIGKTWSIIGREKDLDIHSFVRYDNGFIAVSRTLRYIADSSTTWVDISDGLKTSSRGTVAIVDDFMYACGSYSGIWRKPLSNIVHVDNDVIDEKQIESVALWPMPTSNIATLTITNAIPGDATIAFFNVLGTQVLTSTMNVLSGGDHSVTIDTSCLPNGWYTVLVTTGNEVVVGRCIVEHE